MSYGDVVGAMAALRMHVLLYIVPFMAYFLGIYIRRVCFPAPDAPSLKILLLLGIPVCLLVVTPIIESTKLTLLDLGGPYLLTIGMIMEHGMVLHETVIARFRQATPFGRNRATRLQRA